MKYLKWSLGFCLLCLLSLKWGSATEKYVILHEQPAISLAYLYIDVTEHGKIKRFKSGQLKGSKSEMRRNMTVLIKKYVPKNAKANCKITLAFTKIQKNTSMGQKKKNISGNGVMIHQNLDEVLHRLL